MGGVLAIVAILAVLAAGGSVWLLVRDGDGHGRRQTSRARRVRRLAGTSGLVVLASLAALRPWYWDVGLAAVVAAGFLAVDRALNALLRRPSASWTAVAMAMASVLLGAGLVTLGGTAAVLDAAALTGAGAAPSSHGGPVLSHAVVYQLFWGPSWSTTPPPPALRRAATFEANVARSSWTSTIVASGFGIRSLVSGGCWIDPVVSARGARASSMEAGVLPQELRRVFGPARSDDRRLRACPGTELAGVPAGVPPDALVVVWLDPSVTYALGGVSVHGVVPWPGRPHGLAVSALNGGYASWQLPTCASGPACRALPARSSPTYALSHEIVETVVNPYGGGWFADPPLRWTARYVLDHGPPTLWGTVPAFPGEVADLCEPGQTGVVAAHQALASGRGGADVAPFFRPGRGCGG